jgi:MTH538 TIR-like domain (DUF1863)
MLRLKTNNVPIYCDFNIKEIKMADPRAFVSFDFDHNESEKILFVGQSKNSKTPFSIHDWSAKSSMPQTQWEAIVKEKINKCNMLIVLVGKTMASAFGVAKEIKMAKDQNVPVFGVYVGGADSSSNLPDGLQCNRTIKWEWDAIADAVTQMMGEGKNK